MKRRIDTTLLDRAIIFAVSAHQGVARKGSELPYIVHPMEAVSIVATMTGSQELLAAAALHDVVEDAGVTAEDLRQQFGERVAQLVLAESDIVVDGSRGDTWRVRKQAALDRLASAGRDVKMVALGDKLSNMRAIARDHAALGSRLWQRFNVDDPAAHAWRYRMLAEALADLSDTAAYQEFRMLIDKVFPPSDSENQKTEIIS